MNNKEFVINKVKEYFSELHFLEDTHQYKYEGEELKSVSTTIKDFCEEFDKSRIAYYVAKKRGISVNDVLLEWEQKKNEGCNIGNETHMFGENYSEDSVARTGYEKAILQFWKTVPEYVEPVFRELKMFSKDLKIAGTADLIFYNNNTGKFIICDYKTNNDLFKNYKGKNLLYPFEAFNTQDLTKELLKELKK